jgi:hypothetical protein
MLGGILWHVGLAAPGRGQKGLAVVHAGSALPLTGVTSLAPQTRTPPKHHVTLSWRAGPPTGTSVDDGIAGYNVLRRRVGINVFTSYMKINSDLVVDTNYVDDSVTPGESYEYETTAVNYRGTESSPSNQVTVTIPSP